MSNCATYVILAAMAGALTLLCVLVSATLVLRFFPEPLMHDSDGTARRSVQLNEQRHADEAGRLHDKPRETLRGSGRVCGPTRRDGGGTGVGDVRGGQDTRAGAFSRLREESREYTPGSRG